MTGEAPALQVTSASSVEALAKADVRSGGSRIEAVIRNSASSPRRAGSGRALPKFETRQPPGLLAPTLVTLPSMSRALARSILGYLIR